MYRYSRRHTRVMPMLCTMVTLMLLLASGPTADSGQEDWNAMYTRILGEKEKYMASFEGRDGLSSVIDLDGAYMPGGQDVSDKPIEPIFSGNLALKLEHPLSLVLIYEVGSSDGEPYMEAFKEARSMISQKHLRYYYIDAFNNYKEDASLVLQGAEPPVDVSGSEREYSPPYVVLVRYGKRLVMPPALPINAETIATFALSWIFPRRIAHIQTRIDLHDLFVGLNRKHPGDDKEAVPHAESYLDNAPVIIGCFHHPDGPGSQYDVFERMALSFGASYNFAVISDSQLADDLGITVFPSVVLSHVDSAALAFTDHMTYDALCKWLVNAVHIPIAEMSTEMMELVSTARIPSIVIFIDKEDFTHRLMLQRLSRLAADYARRLSWYFVDAQDGLEGQAPTLLENVGLGGMSPCAFIIHNDVPYIFHTIDGALPPHALKPFIEDFFAGRLQASGRTGSIPAPEELSRHSFIPAVYSSFPRLVDQYHTEHSILVLVTSSNEMECRACRTFNPGLDIFREFYESEWQGQMGSRLVVMEYDIAENDPPAQYPVRAIPAVILIPRADEQPHHDHRRADTQGAGWSCPPQLSFPCAYIPQDVGKSRSSGDWTPYLQSFVFHKSPSVARAVKGDSQKEEL